MTRCRLPFLMLLPVLAAGCAVGPDYRPPGFAMPSAYLGRDVLQPADAGTPPGDGTQAEAWWSAFGDPQLTRFVALALRQNLELSQASARVLQSRAGLQAAGAALLPSVNLGTQASRVRQSVETPIGRVLDSVVPGFDRYGNAYEADLTVAWELDLFGGSQRAQQASRAEFEGSQATASAVRLAVAAQTADTYIAIRGLQARLGVAQRQAQTQQKLLSAIGLRFQKGLAAELQVRQAEGALVRAQAAVPVLQAALDAATNALDVMLGAFPGTHRAELAEARAIPSVPRLAFDGALGDLLRRRPDLVAAERLVAARNARIGVAVAEYYPKISLSGLIGSATTLGSGNLFTSGASQALATVGLRWRLFDFGRVDARIRSAEAQESEALAAYRQAVLRATEEVENSLSSFGRRQEQAALLGGGVDSLTRARNASAAAFDKGVVSLIEVLQADDSLLSVTDGQVQARTETTRSAVAIFKALGGGWNAAAAPAALEPSAPAAPPRPVAAPPADPHPVGAEVLSLNAAPRAQPRP